MKGRKTVWKSILLTVMLFVWTCMAVPVLAEEASGDNSLSSLGITTEGVTVSPDFYYSTIEYQVTVPSGTSRLELDYLPLCTEGKTTLIPYWGVEVLTSQVPDDLLPQYRPQISNWFNGFTGAYFTDE